MDQDTATKLKRLERVFDSERATHPASVIVRATRFIRKRIADPASGLSEIQRLVRAAYLELGPEDQ